MAFNSIALWGIYFSMEFTLWCMLLLCRAQTSIKGQQFFFEKSTEHVVFVVLWNFIVKDLNFACNDALWEFFFTMKFHTNCFTRKFIKKTWEFIFSSMYLISLKISTQYFLIFFILFFAWLLFLRFQVHSLAHYK